MPVVLSVLSIGHTQVDGSRYITERHTDNAGLVHAREYLERGAPTPAQRDALMAAYAVQLDEQLKAGEVQECLAHDRLTLVYVTKTDLAARIRALYRIASASLLARIARWIRRRIAAGDFTEDQVRNAFGLTLLQWEALKTRMQDLVQADDVVQGAQGE